MFIWFHRKDSCLYLKSMGIALEIKRNMWLTKLNLRHRMWSFNFFFFCLSQCDRIQTKIAEYHRCSFTPVTDIADPNDVLIQTQQLLLLFYCCQNFVSYVTINGEMWADVALTVCFLHWAAWQARATSAFLEMSCRSFAEPPISLPLEPQVPHWLLGEHWGNSLFQPQVAPASFDWVYPRFFPMFVVVPGIPDSCTALVSVPAVFS